MADQYVKGMWKLRAPKKLPKSTTPMVGMVYEGVDKFFGKRTIGVLVEMFDQNDEAIPVSYTHLTLPTKRIV